MFVSRAGIFKLLSARLHCLAELVPWNRCLGSVKVKKIRALVPARQPYSYSRFLAPIYCSKIPVQDHCSLSLLLFCLLHIRVPSLSSSFVFVWGLILSPFDISYKLDTEKLEISHSRQIGGICKHHHHTHTHEQAGESIYSVLGR